MFCSTFPWFSNVIKCETYGKWNKQDLQMKWNKQASQMKQTLFKFNWIWNVLFLLNTCLDNSWIHQRFLDDSKIFLEQLRKWNIFTARSACLFSSHDTKFPLNQAVFHIHFPKQSTSRPNQASPSPRTNPPSATNFCYLFIRYKVFIKIGKKGDWSWISANSVFYSHWSGLLSCVTWIHKIK